MTSPAPAIGGIAVGETNDAASMNRRPGLRERVDQAHPLVDRDRRLVLQAVTRSDLTDVDACGPGGHAHHVTRPGPLGAPSASGPAGLASAEHRRGSRNEQRGLIMSVVLITGCSTGIGLETALAFAAPGRHHDRDDAQCRQGRHAEEAGRRRRTRHRGRGARRGRRQVGERGGRRDPRPVTGRSTCSSTTRASAMAVRSRRCPSTRRGP